MKNTIKILFLILPLASFSQTWQWAKSGGSWSTTIYESDIERVKSISTDKDGNVYILAPIGKSEAKIDGIPKTTYNEFASSVDHIIAKFGCDGTYKWSRVMGGNDSDYMQRVFNDSLGNVYSAGNLIRNSSFYLPKFGKEGLTETDTILPFPQRRGLFLVKYDSIGEMKWLRMPQPANITFSNAYTHTTSIDLSVDAAGNSYWLCGITSGDYAEGAFVNEVEGTSIVLFQYNAMGDFVSATPLQMDASGTPRHNLKMTRNPSNGTIYVAGNMNPSSSSTEEVLLNGEPVTHRAYVAAFTASGDLLWKRENTSTLVYKGITSIELDSDGAIYIAGGTGIPDSFNGVPFQNPTPKIFPYLIKLDTNGNTVWSTNGFSSDGSFAEGISLNGDEVAVTGGAKNLVWAGDTIALPTAGIDVYIARFNKNTGVGLGLHTLPSNIGGQDFGTAISSDIHGNYLVGGKFASKLFVGGETLQNPGPQVDFFVAKFGSDTCQVLSTESFESKNTLKAYPNPSSGTVTINLDFDGTYNLYNSYGSQVATGQLTADLNTIDLSRYSSGIYLLVVKDSVGKTSNLKILKK